MNALRVTKVPKQQQQKQRDQKDSDPETQSRMQIISLSHEMYPQRGLVASKSHSVIDYSGMESSSLADADKSHGKLPSITPEEMKK